MKFTGFLPMHLIGYYKLNVDGATFANLQAIGVGVLICDSAGKVEVALSKKRLIPLGPLRLKPRPWRKDFILHGMLESAKLFWNVISRLF